MRIHQVTCWLTDWEKESKKNDVDALRKKQIIYRANRYIKIIFCYHANMCKGQTMAPEKNWLLP